MQENSEQKDFQVSRPAVPIVTTDAHCVPGSGSFECPEYYCPLRRLCDSLCPSALFHTGVRDVDGS